MGPEVNNSSWVRHAQTTAINTAIQFGVGALIGRVISANPVTVGVSFVVENIARTVFDKVIHSVIGARDEKEHTLRFVARFISRNLMLSYLVGQGAIFPPAAVAYLVVATVCSLIDFGSKIKKTQEKLDNVDNNTGDVQQQEEIPQT